MKKLPISLIIIARNEEKNLPRCLDSAAPWVSEIIGVINDCTDNTRGILESYGAKVYEHDWPGSTDQKNKALEYASQPWILSLDADEEITPQLARSIQEFFNNKDTDKFDGAFSARKTWFLGRWIKHGDWYPDYMLRLFRKEKGRFSGGKDHEKVALNGEKKKLKGDLLHYSFDSISHMLTKFPRFGDAFLKHKLEGGGKRFCSIETILRSFWRCFRCYVIRRGFLDGFPGVYIALNQGFYTLFRYTHLYEHERRNQNPELEATDK